MRLRIDSIIIRNHGVRESFSTREVLSLQVNAKNTRGVLRGAVIGAGAAFVLTATFADGAGSSDAAGAAALGGLVGAAWGASKPSRIGGGIGFLLGAAIGAIVFGSSSGGCESGADAACDVILGGAYLGSIGLVAGSAVGYMFPNWLSVPLR